MNSNSLAPNSRRAMTLVDVLVGVAIVALAVGSLMPTLARARDRSGQDTSAANLQTLALAHAMYGWDFNDRQVTWVPDEAGIATALNNGNYLSWSTFYTNMFGCPSQLLLGWGDEPTPAIWGYFLGCDGYPGSGVNGVVYVPNAFSLSGGSPLPDGAFRLPNAAAFSGYVDGRFYSEIFYAPNDIATYDAATPHFDEIAQFLQLPGEADLVNSSYALSPAAMWNSDVLGKNALTGTWWRNPGSFFEGFISPTVSQCMHPELKTRMIEHHWNDGAPAVINPSIPGGETPYLFNHGIDAAPLALFFDGSVDVLSTSNAVADDAKVFAATRGEVGLWTRDTPLGALGYAGAYSYDGTLVSHHVLTAGGILGRDVLDRSGDSGRPAHGGLAAPIWRSAPAAQTFNAATPTRTLPAPILQAVPVVP